MVRRYLLALLLLSPFAAAQNKRPFNFEDMMKLKRVAEPYLSPDGKWAAFGVTDVSLDENKKTNHIWVVPVAGGETKQLTSGKGEDGYVSRRMANRSSTSRRPTEARRSGRRISIAIAAFLPGNRAS